MAIDHEDIEQALNPENVIRADGEDIHLTTVRDVRNALHDVAVFIEDEQTLQAFMSMCLIFNIDADKLAEQWFEFQSKNPKVGLVPSQGFLDIFQKNFLTKEYIQENQLTVKDVLKKRKVIDEFDEADKTEEDYKETKDESETPMETSNPLRSGEGDGLTAEERDILLSKKITLSFGNERKETEFYSPIESQIPNVTVTSVDTSRHLTPPVTLLKFRQLDFSSTMDEEISKFEELYAKQGIEITPLTAISASTAFYVGRIIKEPSLQSSKLSAASVMLEGIDNRRVKLDLSFLEEDDEDDEDENEESAEKKNYSFFPGQFVCIECEGRVGEQELKVLRVLDPVIASSRKVDAADIIQEPFQIIVVSGPLRKPGETSAPNVTKLIQYIRTSRPHLVILIGPIVDSRNEKDFLRPESNRELKSLLDNISSSSPLTKVVVIPSPDDYFTHLNVTPTLPFDMTPPSESVFLFPNPSFFRAGGYSFAVSSTDIIRHLTKEEISNASGERIKRLVNHIVTQQNVYPLFPPDLDANIDYSFYHHLKMPEKPDILILPSDLKHFAYNLNGTLCLNTDRLSKGMVARLRIDPPAKDSAIVENISAQVFRL